MPYPFSFDNFITLYLQIQNNCFTSFSHRAAQRYWLQVHLPSTSKMLSLAELGLRKSQQSRWPKSQDSRKAATCLPTHSLVYKATLAEWPHARTEGHAHGGHEVGHLFPNEASLPLRVGGTHGEAAGTRQHWPARRSRVFKSPCLAHIEFSCPNVEMRSLFKTVAMMQSPFLPATKK
jgi:hypothetical protein